MNLKLLLAWRVASCYLELPYCLYPEQTRCLGLKGSNSDPWLHTLLWAAGNSELFWFGYAWIKLYNSSLPTWTKAGRLDRQKSITGSLFSNAYGDLSMDLDGICWQDHFLYGIFLLTGVSPKGFYPRWSQPRQIYQGRWWVRALV